MVTENDAQNKLKDIVNLLPRKNCGKCGYENCPKFAMAVIKREASPFGCSQDSSAGYAISNVLGLAVPDAQTAPQAGTGLGNAHGKHHGDKHHSTHFKNSGHSGHSGHHGRN
jgi:Na+-translocating ferredoxin:NAD+ oxidoreductase RNF subunit RnfB